MSLPLATAERFRADLRHVWTASLDAGVRFCVAVSGGPDSLALLLLAHAARPGQFEAVTVDHGLRSESGEEAAHVAAICASLGVPHTTLVVEVGGGNLHDAAREARYRAMGEWALAQGMYGILTAHHADDQAETVLMRLNRGSGLSGLSGIRRLQTLPTGVGAYRPLLGWRKAELEEIVAAARLTPVRDPSNEDPRFDRARIRAAIGDAGWLDPLAISRSAEYLQDAELALGIYGNDTYERTVEYEGETVVWNPVEVPRTVRILCVLRALAEAGAQDCSMSDAARLHDRIVATGKGGNVGGIEVRTIRGVWHFAREPERRTG